MQTTSINCFKSNLVFQNERDSFLKITPYHQSLGNRVSAVRRYTVNFGVIYGGKIPSRWRNNDFAMPHKNPREENLTTS